MRNGTILSRFASSEAVALLCAFLLLVVGGAALADRNIDPSAELLRRTTAAAERAGAYRFVTSQRYAGDLPKGSAYSAGVLLQGGVDIDAGVTQFDTVVELGRIEAKCSYLTIGDDLFVSVHPSRRKDLGASWLRVRAEGAIAVANLQGLRPDQLDERTLRLFEGLEPDGRATIRGVRTTRYRGEIDIAAFASSPSAQRAVTKQVGRTLPIAVYIDDDDLLRRLTIELGAGRRAGVTFTTDLFDYGDQIRVRRPPAGAVKMGDRNSFAVACYPKVFPRTSPVPAR